MQELPILNSQPAERLKKPDWLRVKLPIGESYKHVRGLVDNHKLHTICESGNCPNMGECWGEGTATFMILGNICTRSCQFCAVATGRPKPVEWDEPQRVAEAVYLMKVKHAVLTSVDRDELPDGGSIIWSNTIKAIKTLSPDTTLETLIPDFRGIQEQIDRIIDVLTLGQYLQPTKKHLPVQRFVHPDEFAELRQIGYELGFDYVESGPLVRSSYHSEKHVIKGWGRNKWMEEQVNK